MDLRKEFDQRLEKIDQLKDFIVLYGKKCECIEEISSLSNETLEVNGLLQKCSESIEQFKNHNNIRLKTLVERAQQQQTLMLNIMEKLDEMSEVFVPPQPKSLNENVLKENMNTPLRCTQFKNLHETPIMNFSDYLKSPYTTKRSKPIALQFSDFDRTIEPNEFAKIPSYMRGRETRDDIQQFLDGVIIKALTLKYALLPKRREAVAPCEMDLWNMYKSQEEYFKGLKFITQGDICRLTNKQIDKKSNTRITILRHLKILREERKQSAICYIYTINL